MLARLDLFEDLAELAESETVEELRSRLRTRYRQLTGIEPERRAALTATLTRVVDGTGEWNDVETLLHGTAYENGSVVSFRDDSLPDESAD